MGNYLTTTTEEFIPPKMVAPVDDDDPHYIKSFRIDQKDEYTKFFEEYGFVVVRDVLNEAECRASIDDIWTYIETRAFMKHPMFDKEHTIKRDSPSTWDNGWPSMAAQGIIGGPPVFRTVPLNNRQNPNVYDVFSTLLGTKSLMVNHDRYGLFRPTRNADGQPSNAHWATIKNIHLDMNPWRYMGLTGPLDWNPLDGLDYEHDSEFIAENNELGDHGDGMLHVQGLINLADNHEEDGGFQIVPGFGPKHFEEWTRSTQATLCKRYLRRQTFIVMPDDSPLVEHAQRVTARAGSLVVWDQRTLHGSAPNDSSNIRYAQFIKMSPAVDLETERGQKRKEAVTKMLAREAFEPSDLGRKLFTLEPWQ